MRNVPTTVTRPPHRALNALAVAILCVWALAVAVAALANAVSGSRFGFTVEVAVSPVIEAVTPGSAAADAGLRAGDRVVLSGIAASERALVEHPAAYKPPGTRLDLPVTRRNRLLHVVLFSRVDPQRIVLAAVGLVVTLVFVGVGGTLVLLRPGGVTWPFLLMSFGYVISEYGAVPARNAFWGELNASLVAACVGLAVSAAAWFVISFPEGSHTRWDRTFRAVALVAAPAIALIEYFATTTQYYTAIGILVVMLLAVAIVRFFEGGADRGRTLWVLVGVIFAFLAVGLHALLSALDPSSFPSSIGGAALSLAPVALPLSVAYAVLRHRVIDVRFALNRALVYGALTSGLVLFFSFVEWLIGKKLEATRLAFYVDLATALGMGFWFNAMHARVERIVESALFRKQHRAEERLERVARAIPHAAAPRTVDAFLTDDPADAYELESAAIFRRADDGTFERVHSSGWANGDASAIPESDELVALLAAEPSSLALGDVRRPLRGRFPAGDAAPILAVPISARARLIGFALYGAHRSGEALNPGERSTLARLAGAAAAAYDHLEAEELRREVERLRALAESTRSSPAEGFDLPFQRG